MYKWLVTKLQWKTLEAWDFLVTEILSNWKAVQKKKQPFGEQKKNIFIFSLGLYLIWEG